MEVWFISVAVKVVQLDSKSHITSLCYDKIRQKASAVQETPLCNIMQLDLLQFSCAIYGLNFVMPQTMKLVHGTN